MSNNQAASDSVRILPPDTTLLKKMGGASLDAIFSKQAIAEAQQIIEHSADEFASECAADIGRLEKLGAILKGPQDGIRSAMPDIVAAAFAIKSKAGLGGYALASKIAKSLQLYCEKADVAHLTSTDISVVAWHVDSLKRLFTNKIKGDGGPIGVAILAEIEKLT